MFQLRQREYLKKYIRQKNQQKNTQMGWTKTQKKGINVGRQCLLHTHTHTPEEYKINKCKMEGLGGINNGAI